MLVYSFDLSVPVHKVLLSKVLLVKWLLFFLYLQLV